MKIGPGSGILCLDLLFTLRIGDDVSEMFDDVMPMGYRLVSTRGTNESSPPEQDHHPRYHHRRPDDLQNNQDGLLPRSERTQIDGCQACPGGCADAEEEGVDVSDVELPIRCPEDDGPEERD
jgi:hypothetical protein